MKEGPRHRDGGEIRSFHCCSKHICQRPSLSHLSKQLKSSNFYTTFCLPCERCSTDPSVFVFPRPRRGITHKLKNFYRQSTHSAGQKTLARSAPPMFLPIHYLWYTQKNEGIIYFAANDEGGGRTSATLTEDH